MKESRFQHQLIAAIKKKFPGCVVMKNDASYIQGIPDLIVLNNDRWAALECKKSKNAEHQPNQDYYINLMNEMSYAAFVYPENKKEVLDDLERSFKHPGDPCSFKSE